MKKAEEKEGCSKNSEEETDACNSSNTDCDQYSEVSLMGDTDEEIDTAEIEEEDWIEHMKRSPGQAAEKMRTANILCWIVTHKTMQWRLAMRIASLPERQDGQKKKAAKWNPALSIGCKASRAVGRLRKRWEDDIHQFLKPEETEEIKGFEVQRHMDTGSKRPNKMERNGK